MSINPDGKSRMAGSNEFKQELNNAAGKKVRREEYGPKGADYQEGQKYNVDGKLTEMGAPDVNNPDTDNNPYTVSNLSDFDLTAGGAGASKGMERLSAQDLKRLHRQGGFGKQELIDYANNTDFGEAPGASGLKAQSLLKKWTNKLSGGVSEPVEESPDSSTEQPREEDTDNPPSSPSQISPPTAETPIPSYLGEPPSANIGKIGDINTTIGNGNLFGAGSSIGNDNSVTFGTQMFGESLALPRRQGAKSGAFAGLRFN